MVPSVRAGRADAVGPGLCFPLLRISLGRTGDTAVCLSTSGGSANVLRAFTEAKRLGMVTVGLAGYDGGAMAASGALDHCLVVGSDSVHRIQEVQSAVVFELWRRVQLCLSVDVSQ